MWDRAQPEFILQNGESITPEVLEFIADRDDRPAVAKFFDSLAQYFDRRQGEIRLDTIAAFCRMTAFYDATVRLPTSSPWKVISYFVHLWLNQAMPTEEREYRTLETDFFRKFTRLNKAPNQILFSILYCLCGLQFHANAKLLARTIGTIVIWNLWTKNETTHNPDLNEPVADMLRSSFSVYTNQQGLVSLTLDLEEMFRFCRKQIRNVCSIKEINEGKLDIEHVQSRQLIGGRSARRQKIILPKGYFVYPSKSKVLDRMIEVLRASG